MLLYVIYAYGRPRCPVLVQHGAFESPSCGKVTHRLDRLTLSHYANLGSG